MTAALAELVDSRLPAARSIDLLPRLQMGQADAFHFRKESAAPPGLIGWRDGEELVRSARQTLVAGAKSHISRLRRFSNRFGQFAGRYLDNVLMGQTAVGSYVVTAYAPVDTPIALTSSKLDLASLPGTEAAPAREVTLAIGRALEATQEAVEHFHSSGSLSGFEAGVSSGISFDLLTALKGITKNSDEGEVALEWISYEATDAQSRESKFTFTAADTPVLERASNRLSAEVETDMESTIVGRVHLLTKKELGGPGVFGMETLPPNAQKLRLRLSDPDEYHA
ncbi:hypothetical protein, partial [Pseudonocardia halophobica]|uniref:hypothetical protein n=1 Tax=Pseudonocardia halophobica TaxID=29401 RepID=UPI0022F3092D